jgi:hypothetical protein
VDLKDAGAWREEIAEKGRSKDIWRGIKMAPAAGTWAVLIFIKALQRPSSEVRDRRQGSEQQKPRLSGSLGKFAGAGSGGAGRHQIILSTPRLSIPCCSR